MGIKLIELIDWLENNSILDPGDEIRSITVDEKKEMVAVQGKSFDKGEEKLIGFSEPFDAVKFPIRMELTDRAAQDNRLKVIEDDEEVRKEPPVIETDKDKSEKKDEQIRDIKPEEGVKDGKNEGAGDKT